MNNITHPSHEANKRIYESAAAVVDHARSGLQPAERILFETYFRKPGRVLDLGCGTGRTSGELLALGHSVDAIDYSEAMIAEAKKRGGSDGVRFEVMDAAALRYPDHTFDCAFFSFNGLDYLYPARMRIKSLSEIRRVLKPGGVFAFSSHSSMWVPNSWRKRWNIMRSFLRGKIMPYRLDFHPFGDLDTYCISPWAQFRQLRKAGFMPVDIISVRTKRASKLAIALRDPYPMYVCRLPEKP